MLKNWYRQILARRWPRIGLIVLLWLLAVIGIARAIELPADTSQAFIQTTGHNAKLGIGDFYTNVDGDQGQHFLRVTVPCTWPGDQTITFALFDPEIQEPDPPTSIEPPFADDEIRDAANNKVNMPPDSNIQFADVTTFTLFAMDASGTTLDRTVVPPVTYVPTLTNSTNGLWVEFVTFTPNTPNFGCGVYALSSETADNDDNAWKLSVSHDPDCSVSVPGNPGNCAGVGSAQSTQLSNGNELDSADGLPGTGNDLLISADRLSYQHESPSGRALTCQTFYHPVYPNDRPEVRFNDFDLDTNNGTGDTSTVKHTSPTGRVIIGAGSANKNWNNGTSGVPPVRGGDVIQVAPDEVGLWQSEVCVRRDNQYIFEGQQDEVVFLEPPPAPNMALSKDDGRTVVAQSDILTYTIVFTNISNVIPLGPSKPGAAKNVTLTDQLPPNTTFVSCDINPPFTGTCVQSSPGIVTAQINEIVIAGARGTIDLAVQVDPNAPAGLLTNTVQLDFQGSLLGIQYPPLTAIDINQVPPQAPPPDTPTPIPPDTPTPIPPDTPTPIPPDTPTPIPPDTPTPIPPDTPTPAPTSDPGGGGGPVSTPEPPPPSAPPVATVPPGATVVAAAPAPQPTPTPAVLYLPETGLRNGEGLNPAYYIGLVLLLGVSLSGLLIWRARHD